MARTSTEKTVDRVIGDHQFKALIKARNQDKEKISEISGGMGERERLAVKNAYLHGAAFKQVAKLAKMEELKREDYLRSFTVYVDKARRLKIFGEEHAGDLGDMADEDEGRAGDGRGEDEGAPVKLSDAAARTVHANGIKKLEPKGKGKAGKGLAGGDAPGGTRIQ